MGIVGRLRRFLPQGEFGRGILTLVGGTGAAMVVVTACSPILTRLYSPSDFGIYAVATSILAILITVTCLRYEFAIPLPATDVAAANLLALAVITAVVVSLASGVVLWLAGPWLLALFGAPGLGPYVPLLTIGQLGGGIVSVFTNWAVRTKTFSEIALNRLTQSGTLVAVQIGLGIVGLGTGGLLVGDVAGRAAGSSRLARVAWRSDAASFRRVSRAGILFAAQRYRRFPALSAPSALLNTLAMQSPLLLIVALYGADVGGQYALADRLCSLPLTLVAGAVGQVFVSMTARLAREQPAALRTRFARTTRSLARVAIGPAIVLAVVAPVLAGAVFGQAWGEAGLFVTILTPMYYLTFVASPTGEILNILERQRLLLGREVLRFGLLGGAIPFAAMMHLPPVGAIAALSLAGCLTYSLYGLISWRAIVTYQAQPQLTPTTDVGQMGDGSEDWISFPALTADGNVPEWLADAAQGQAGEAGDARQA